LRIFRSSDPQKYIVAVEGGYDKATVTLVINDRMRIKKWLNINLNLLWFKEDVTQLIYGGKRLKIIEACQKYGVKLTKLRTCVMMVTHQNG
jgi:hypothetical protein